MKTYVMIKKNNLIQKISLIMIIFLTLPGLAEAWYMNAKTSPTSGAGTISPSGTVQYAIGVDSNEFTVTPANGYMVSRVTLDGITIYPKFNGKYAAPYDSTKTWRYIVASFTVAPPINITTSVPLGNGTIAEDTGESLTNITAGSTRQLLITPDSGYVTTFVDAPYGTITDLGNGKKQVTFTNLQSSKSVSATFTSYTAGPQMLFMAVED